MGVLHVQILPHAHHASQISSSMVVFVCHVLQVHLVHKAHEYARSARKIASPALIQPNQDAHRVEEMGGYLVLHVPIVF
jgi:hypothetical protein